jgi:hypothetical protein
MPFGVAFVGRLAKHSYSCLVDDLVSVKVNDRRWQLFELQR